MEEDWLPIAGFSDYSISNYGNVYNMRRSIMMSTSISNHGYHKVSLVDDEGFRVTKSISYMVAEAFVEAPDWKCDHVIFKDGNILNPRADNLEWRPRWYAWKYSRQMKVDHPQHYQNLIVHNIRTDKVYDSVIQAGVALGLLFHDIWRSTYTGDPVYPNWDKFEIMGRL